MEIKGKIITSLEPGMEGRQGHRERLPEQVRLEQNCE